jgi:hypothetical protein
VNATIFCSSFLCGADFSRVLVHHAKLYVIYDERRLRDSSWRCGKTYGLNLTRTVSIQLHLECDFFLESLEPYVEQRCRCFQEHDFFSEKPRRVSSLLENGPSNTKNNNIILKPLVCGLTLGSLLEST